MVAALIVFGGAALVGLSEGTVKTSDTEAGDNKAEGGEAVEGDVEMAETVGAAKVDKADETRNGDSEG